MNAQLPSENPSYVEHRVVVVDVDMPFGSMVTLLLKFVFALVPAAFVVTLVTIFAFVALTALRRM